MISLNSTKAASRRRDKTFRIGPKKSSGRTFIPFTSGDLKYPGNPVFNRLYSPAYIRINVPEELRIKVRLRFPEYRNRSVADTMELKGRRTTPFFFDFPVKLCHFSITAGLRCGKRHVSIEGNGVNPATTGSTFRMEESMAVSAQELQAVIDRFPKTALAELPTPLHDCPRFSEALGGKVRVLVKRDDLTGLAFGGNKTRKFRSCPWRRGSERGRRPWLRARPRSRTTPGRRRSCGVEAWHEMRAGEPSRSSEPVGHPGQSACWTISSARTSGWLQRA